MKAFTRFLIAAIGAAALASCTQNGDLIYLNIQKTQKTGIGTTIPLNVTVAEMVGTGTPPVGPGTPACTAPYYVACGKIYVGTVANGTTNWSPITVPQAGSNSMLCNALTWDGTYLWGGFFSPDGGTVGLYQMNPAAVGTWNQVSGFPNSTQQVIYVKYAGSILFVVTATMVNGSFVYSLGEWNEISSSWNPTATFITLPNLQTSSTLSSPITGIAYDGTNYYATSGYTIYSAPVSSPAAFTTLFQSAQQADIFRGIYIDMNYLGTSTELVLVPSSNQIKVTNGIGGIYYSFGSPNQLTFAEATTNASTSYTVGFLCVAGPLDPTTTHYMYLLGADSGYGGAFGFFSFNPSNNSLNRFTGLSYSLYASAVNRILVDTTNNFVLMGTVNNGLWLTNPVDPTGSFSSASWTQE